MRVLSLLFLLPLVLATPLPEQDETSEADIAYLTGVVESLFGNGREAREMDGEDDEADLENTLVEEEKSMSNLVQETNPAEIERFNAYMDAIYRRMNAALRSELNENIDYLGGIEGHELAAMEMKLRDECLEAAGIYDTADGAPSTMNVYYQLKDGSNEERPVALTPETTLSVAETYAHLNTQSPVPIKYYRLPIADESAPGAHILTDLVDILGPIALSDTPTSAVVFNCQMGRGRTTTGMVCATILHKAAKGWALPDGSPTALPSADDDGRDLAKGEFKGIMRLLVLLGEIVKKAPAVPLLKRRSSVRAKPIDRGVECKLLADESIVDCGEVQNLTSAILQCVDSIATADPNSNRPPAFWQRRAINYLERYAFIIIFAAYCLIEADNEFRTPFSAWLRCHWSLRRTLAGLTLD